jgi:hypothetical protein
MRYVLDKNILTKDLLKNVKNRRDLCITNEVISEAGFDKKEIEGIKKAGIVILTETKKFFEKLKEVINKHGNNLKLINLYTSRGTADVAMIAHILAEKDSSNQLFTEEFVIVTKDDELTAVAIENGITCVTKIS